MPLPLFNQSKPIFYCGDFFTGFQFTNIMLSYFPLNISIKGRVKYDTSKRIGHMPEFSYKEKTRKYIFEDVWLKKKKNKELKEKKPVE